MGVPADAATLTAALAALADLVAIRREGVACDWPYRHAEVLSVEREGWCWTPRCPVGSNRGQEHRFDLSLDRPLQSGR
ncbi:MAG: hypothetical protein QOG67_267 [Verrucomicrobiota bacterium]